MSDIVKKISSPDFNADKYVKEISQVCIGGLELQKHKTAILAHSERTNQALKKNVYQNYMQFIETAREISHLEGDMYQLSRLLSEQRGLLAGMGCASVPQELDVSPLDPQSAAKEKEEKESKRLAALAQISEKVESCISLSDVAGRELLHEGDLVELDLMKSTAIHRCHAFLLSDMLIITTWISNRRGSAKYKYEAGYELGSLAVVNVRNLDNVKYAFKLLVFPDTRLFQCANQQAKEIWLSKLDEAKRAKINSEKKQSADSASANQSTENTSPLNRMDSIDSTTNAGGSYSEWALGDSPDSDPSTTPDWVLDSPEDLDVSIAQRHFEEALELIQRTNAHLEKAPLTPTNVDIKTKIEARVKSLTEVLLSELSVSSEKSMQGGLRASRRAVKLLNKLGKTHQACQLYLRLCTSVLKSQTKRVKREFATTAYVRQLSTVFFSNLAIITTEFQYKAFGPAYPSCSATFAVWASSEVSHFTSNIIKQVFMPQTPLNTLAECVDIVTHQCQQLTEVGLDLRYQVEGQLNNGVSKALAEARDRTIDAGKQRAVNDQWKPSHHTKPQLHKLVQEFMTFGLPSVKNYLTGDGWLELTNNTITFTRSFLSLLLDGLKVCTLALEYNFSKVLSAVFDSHLAHVAASYKIDRLQPQRALIMKNAVFLLDHLLRISNNYYKQKMGHTCKALEKLKSEYSPCFAEKSTSV